jgi:hypothetical protein
MGLNMKRKDKITIASGLSLGIFAGACSVVRTIELRSMSSMENYVYDTASMLLWSSTEVFLTIVCACVPVLRPLYVRIKYGSHGDSSGQKSYPLKDYSKSKSSHGMDGSKKSEKIYMGPGESVLQTTVRMGSDTASEETILRESNANDAWNHESGNKDPGDITITTTVTSRDDYV